MDKKQKEAIGNLIEAIQDPDYENLVEWGKNAFNLQSVHGLPIEITLDKLKEGGMSKRHCLVILSEYQVNMIEHKRLAGTEEKNLDKQRSQNLKDLVQFWKDGELK